MPRLSYPPTTRESLGACLNSLNYQRLSSQDDFNVVVVDDGSDDVTSEFISTLTVDYEIRSEFIPKTEFSGRSRARNRGISLADGDLIIFVDADHIRPPDFVNHDI